MLVAIEDEVTGTQPQVGRIVVGVHRTEQGLRIVRDWELLLLILNGLGAVDVASSPSLAARVEEAAGVVAKAQETLAAAAPFMRRARPWLEILLLPDEAVEAR
ncbi:hypothetical protein NF701_08335 [Sphingomonadaceae bacterium OTU29THOMA1]|nr:hypothetical protein NF701_08335 [Sphingomonadaceae bacterium OTU29THOMA1]